MTGYSLGLFANMFPAFDGDYRGIFIGQMVKDLESRGVTIKKAVKKAPAISGYGQFFYESLRLARDRDLDLMQAEYIPHSSLIPAFFRWQKVPLILKFHGDDARIYPFKNRFNLMITKSMIKRAAYVITGSEEMKRILVGIGTSPKCISAIHTGVNTTFFAPLEKDTVRHQLGLTPEGTIFCFVGRLHSWKGIGEILEVAKRNKELRFFFAGPGPVPPHSDNCTFLGTQPPENVRLWMNAADCLILPTYTESVPSVVMEAFACGVPAITSDAGGCPEIVEEGKNGLLVPVRDVKKLETAVAWMNEHPDERREMGRFARHTAVDRYDHDMLIERLIKVHRSLIS